MTGRKEVEKGREREEKNNRKHRQGRVLRKKGIEREGGRVVKRVREREGE